MSRNDQSDLDSDAVLSRWKADSAHINVRENFDAAVLEKVAAQERRANAIPPRSRPRHARWVIPALAAAAALAALLITRSLDDPRDAQSPATPSISFALNNDEDRVADVDDDAFGLVVATEIATAADRESDTESIAAAAFAEVFSSEEIAFLEGRSDDGVGDEVADEISEMSEEAARGLEGLIDSARKTKSG